MPNQLLTIGAYGYTADTFFEALQAANVNVFCDIRWRRGVRGSEYAFANAGRLQTRLEELGIHYLPFRALAPPPEIRQRQLAVDEKEKIAKRKRTTLDPAFISAYYEAILNPFDPQTLLDQLPSDTQTLILFCVERDPAACHRSLVAERLGKVWGVEVKHLMP